MPNAIRKIVGVITLSVFNLFIGCGDVDNELEPITFQLDARLEIDIAYHWICQTGKLYIG